MRWVWTAVAMAAAAPLAAQSFDVPSGQPIQLYQELMPGDGLLYLSFLAPEIAEREMKFDVAAEDLDVLCQSIGLEKMKESDREIVEIVIRLFSDPIDYGTSNPDVKQFLNAYDVSNGSCEWY